MGGNGNVPQQRGISDLPFRYRWGGLHGLGGGFKIGKESGEGVG